MFLFTRKTVRIPTYIQGEAEDPVDLQIKSLQYMFNRLQVENLVPFLNSNGGYELKYKPGLSPELVTDIINDKLDVMYNKAGMEQTLVEDEHRILVDFAKNKFRTLCILSGTPHRIKRLPELSSSKGNPFGFSVLKPSASDDEYVQALASSNIYFEHTSIDMAQRVELACAVVAARRGASAKTFDKDDRAFIIREYLTKLAFDVQTQRIYRASMVSQKQVLAVPSRLPSRSPSPSRLQNQRSIGDFRSLAASNSPFLKLPSPISSTQDLKPHIPGETRALPGKAAFTVQNTPNLQFPAFALPPLLKPHVLKKKQSMGILNADALYALSALPVKLNEPALLVQSSEERADLFEQCKSAVVIKIDRERKLLRSLAVEIGHGEGIENLS
ncbi:hypothetical protein BABINDRAFT_169233 [Babjeviella inositovora NRRL Y-12698]|uniref:Uncharacterized protein n=1 Tax=Babjeviella inositovora NRRL Y-12698 TaxID=984486 RepID=A0A1E3QI22_9ASCO|nr:uncharacterized protein BABINDRAFT_169233 [Babjeviella inositovora NRRL Y-12698]ODQ77363.1 hypothetical protein BABINDRAFT_169233 [Babjeviella inositovora NRRL Y-12698]